MTNTAWDDGLTEAERDEVARRYDASERARVHCEWEARDCPEHECDPLDMYLGGCAICGSTMECER